MRYLVVYDSVFGNTQQVAQAIAHALGPDAPLSVKEADPSRARQCDLLIVGSPTRAFRPTPAIGAFLRKIPREGLVGVKVAAFDTRIALADIDARMLRMLVRWFGYAAGPIMKGLTAQGGTPASAPEGFLVADTEGPLKEGELERAKVWAANLKRHT